MISLIIFSFSLFSFSFDDYYAIYLLPAIAAIAISRHAITPLLPLMPFRR
jgi:hypothetical protein